MRNAQTYRHLDRARDTAEKLRSQLRAALEGAETPEMKLALDLLHTSTIALQEMMELASAPF